VQRCAAQLRAGEIGVALHGMIEACLHQVCAASNNHREISASQVGSAWQYLHADALGNVRQVTDASGAVLGSRRYSPFGEVVAGTGSLSPLGFTGEQQNAASGLTYLRARYYHPALGRFLTPDSIVPDAADGQAWNAYAYAYNDVVNRVDPSGFAPGPQNPINICTYTPICSSWSKDVSELVGDALSSAWQQMNQAGNNIAKWWDKKPCTCQLPNALPGWFAYSSSAVGAVILGVTTTPSDITAKIVKQQRMKDWFSSTPWAEVPRSGPSSGTYAEMLQQMPGGRRQITMQAKRSFWGPWEQTRWVSRSPVRKWCQAREDSSVR